MVIYTQALWSPIVLEGVMRGQDWHLVRGFSGHSYVSGGGDPLSWVEVYRFGG